MARMSAWMHARDVTVALLTPRVVEQFLAARRERCRAESAACRGVRTVLRVLRTAGVVPRYDPADGSPVESLLADFRGYLVRERGLAAATVRSYCLQAGKFLRHLPEPLVDALALLDAATVTTFVVGRTTDAANVGSAKPLVTALRALLRYVHVEGVVEARMVGAVPAVAG
jgi:integrase/recombinase XerD